MKGRGMRVLRTILILVFLTACCGRVSAQSSLEKQSERRRQAERNLEEIRGLKGRNSSNISASQRDLKLTRNEIAAKREIVAGFDDEIRQVTAEINADTRQARSLDSLLSALKEEYGKFVYSAWKNHKLNNATSFLLASRDFNDATRRISHIRRYNRARVEMGEQIDSLSLSLDENIAKLDIRKKGLDSLKAQSNAAISSLGKDETAYARTLKELEKDRKSLEAREKKERENIAAAQREIDRIMAEQAKADKGRQSQADVVLSGKFEDNKGRLPWPAGGPGAVLDHFGIERRGDGIVKNSKGITIATHPGAEAKAVFDGKVTGVYSIGQFNKCVTVRTGSYVIIYGNLVSTELKNGDPVTLNQTVGRLNSSDNTEMNTLVFQIWRETTALDPETWLRK